MPRNARDEITQRFNTAQNCGANMTRCDSVRRDQTVSDLKVFTIRSDAGGLYRRHHQYWKTILKLLYMFVKDAIVHG